MLQGSLDDVPDDAAGACRAEQNTLGMPVAVMADEYSKETLALVTEIEAYAGMDPYDAQRPKLVPVRAARAPLCMQAQQLLSVSCVLAKR
jgi:hypothetical protein